MPGKFEIMCAVQKGLNSLKLKVDISARDSEWTKTIKTELCEIGRRFGCKVCARDVNKADRDYGEWLYDVTWLEYEKSGPSHWFCGPCQVPGTGYPSGSNLHGNTLPECHPSF